MTFNRFAIGKTIAGVGLAGMLLVGLGATPAEARPPSHAPAHGYRSHHSSHDCDCDRGRGRSGSSRYGASHRDDCRYHHSHQSGSRYGDSHYNDYRYGRSQSNRGPYGDLDRDGRRNYWDQDKDGDGRRNERDDRPKNPRRR